MDLFEVEDYTASYAEDCGHTPWTHNDLVASVGLFGRYVVAKNISPNQSDVIVEIADEIAPTVPHAYPSERRAQFATPGPIALTSHLERLAAKCAAGKPVPAGSLWPASDTAAIRTELGLIEDGDVDSPEEVLSRAVYRVVTATAVSAGVLVRSGEALVGGQHLRSWLSVPEPERRRGSVVESYKACLEPLMETDDPLFQRQMSIAAAASGVILVRSLVDDPMCDGEGMNLGAGTDTAMVGALITMRIASMVELGLIATVNSKFCVPDTHASSLFEALDCERGRRAKAA